MRCLVTVNLVGTDTWGNGYECDCAPCQQYLKTGKLTPAFVIHPSKLFNRELEARGWTLEQFSALSGISIDRLTSPFDIDRDFAQGCAKAFGTSANLWLNLQQNYDRFSANRNL